MEKELLGAALGWTSMVFMLAGYALYGRAARRDQATPNPASWGIWVFVSVLNFTSYFMMGRDWVKMLPSFAASSACIATFFSVLVKGKFKRLEPGEYAVLAAGIAASFVWWLFQSAGYANLLIQAINIVSIAPTVRDVWRNPRGESPLPWFVWASSYLLLMFVVILRWRGNPLELVYPLNNFFCDGAVAALALRRRP